MKIRQNRLTRTLLIALTIASMNSCTSTRQSNQQAEPLGDLAQNDSNKHWQNRVMREHGS